MIKNICIYLSAITFLLLFSCGPSAEEAEAQRIKDSIEVEAVREKMLEKFDKLMGADSIAVDADEEETESDIQE